MEETVFASMRTRSKLAIATFLIFCLLTFLYTASRAGDTGKQPEDGIAMLSLLALIFSSAFLVVIWLQRTIHRRFSRKFANYHVRVPLPAPRSASPEIMRYRSFSLPIREEDLWPKDVLLYLVGGGPYSKAPVYGLPIIILKKDSLVVSGDIVSMEALADNKEVDTEFWNPDPEETYQVPVSEISRVLISHYGLMPILTIWVRDSRGSELMILKCSLTDLPKSIHMLVALAKEQGIISKRINSGTVLEKLIERQFKRVALNAIVTIKGRSLDDEELSRLVK